MGVALRGALGTLVRSYKSMPRNPRVIMASQIGYNLTFSMYYPFLTQYMRALGCTNAQVGLLNAAGMITGVAVGLFSGWLTDRVGRRLSCLIADLVCWSLACLLWGLSGSFAMFLAGFIANGALRWIDVAWNCMLTEDVHPRERLNVYAWINAISILTVFSTPLTTPLIARFGLVPSMRGMLIGSSVLYLGLFIWRHILLRETTAGAQGMCRARGESPLRALQGLFGVLRELPGRRVLVGALLIRTLNYVQYSFRSSFLSVAVVQGMGFGVQAMAAVTVLTGVGMLASQVFILPRVSHERAHAPLAWSLAVSAAGLLLLFFAPQRSQALLYIGIFFNGAGAMLVNTIASTLLANALADASRSQYLAFGGLLTVALGAPVQYFGGLLADIPGIGARLPLVVMAALMGLCLLAAFSSARVSRTRCAAPGL